MSICVYDSLPDEAVEIRENVFVKEQGFEKEFDEIDEKAIHLVMFGEHSHKPVATCRIYESKKRGEFIFGRLAVVSECRGMNLGSQLIQKAEEIVRKKGGTFISLHAQCRVKKFYEKLGFCAYGIEDEDEGCPHLWMRKRLINSVAVLGAGAVGSYLIWGISALDDVELGVIAEGERAERIRRDGCLINDKVYRPQVWTPKEAKKADLLVVALKYNALLKALPSIKEAVGENTIVMSLMNGVDSEEIIAKEVGEPHVLYSVIKIASHKEKTGFYFNPETTIGIIFGELKTPYDSERVQAVKELFGKTEIHFRSTKYIREEVWSKYRLNVCNNLPQAILGAGVGCYRDSVHMKAISDKLKEELEAIALAKGIDMSKVENTSTQRSAVPPSARYSTLQDLDAGRQTEIEMFSGALMRMGKELGIPTPYNEYTYHMIKALEEKNEGVFDYRGENEEPVMFK